MTISITEKEYKSLQFAITQIELDAEAATDEDYGRKASTVLNDLNNILTKYRKKRTDANLFQSVRVEVSRKNRNLRPRDIDKLTRSLVRKLKEKEERPWQK